jgi:glycosyltransferase involved in cell wall biosynthesis
MEHDNVSIHEVTAPDLSMSGRMASIAFEQLWLAKSINRQDLDLVHFPYYLEPAMTRHPFIITIPDMDTFIPSRRHSRWTRAYHNSLIKNLARRSDGVITISEYSKVQIINHLDLPPDKVHVVYCGLGDAFSEPIAESIDDLTGEMIPQGGYMLYAGGLGMRKNLRRMVDAFALARRATGSEAGLVITGDLAAVGQALKHFVERSDYSDFVTFTGYLADAQLPTLYRGAIASIYPSLSEGFGLPVIESMACGIPVITSRDSSMEEIADGNAILVDALDVNNIAAAIGALMNDPVLAESYGGRGPKQAANYSWDKAALQCLELYETVLAQGKAFC